MQDNDLMGRVALLTGASGGIGGALGRRLIAAGVRVAFTYHAHPDQANQLLAEAANAGLEALALAADLADPDLRSLLVERTTTALGPIDLLIANAGYAVPQEEYTEVDLQNWERTLAVNLRAPFLLAQAALPGMAGCTCSRHLCSNTSRGRMSTWGLRPATTAEWPATAVLLSATGLPLA